MSQREYLIVFFAFLCFRTVNGEEAKFLLPQIPELSTGIIEFYNHLKGEKRKIKVAKN